MSSTTSTTKLPTPPTRDTGAVLINCVAVLATAIVGGGLWLMMS